MKPLHLIPAVLLLAQCAHKVKPYTSQQEARRVEAREVEQTGEQLAFGDGKEAGRRDRSAGDPDNYRRHSPMYRPATEKAFADGYREGYQSIAAPGDPARDEGYQLGFDLGVKDRSRKKPSDPEAHAGEYDAKLRASFERGYADGYNR